MNERDISRQKQWQRWLVRLAIRGLIPARVVHDSGGLQRAETLASTGYGLLVLMNHFSLRDGLQILHFLYGSDILRRRATLAPAASHHLEGSPLPVLAERVGVRLLPVASPEAVARHRLAPGSGTSPVVYAREAIATLKAGGIVLLAPQAGRRPLLGEPQMHPVSLLLAQAQRQRVRNVALLFIGLGIAGVTDYALEKVGGLNPCRRYEICVGHTFTLAEALESAGKLRQVDAWAYRQLRNWVPATYRGDKHPPEPLAEGPAAVRY